MKNYIILFLFCLLTPASIAETTTITTSPYHSTRSYYSKHYNTLPSNNLKALEKYAFQRAYTRDAELKRLERLEELAFGSIQKGDINTRYQNVENAILTSPKNNYKRTWQNNINNFFSGQPTGITPSVSPFFSQNYIPSYSSSRLEQFNNSFWNRGYRINNNNYATNSGVKLLD